MNPALTNPPQTPPIGGNRRSLRDNPFYFGHYFNMALHNCYKIMVHLSEKHGLDFDATKIGEGNLSTAPLLTGQKFTPILKSALSNDLRRHFPFLAYLDARADDRKPIELHLPDVQQNLRDALYVLNQLRNNYVHYQNVKPVEVLKDVKGKRFSMLGLYGYGFSKLRDRYNHAEKGFSAAHIAHLALDTGQHLPPDVSRASPDDGYYEKSLA